jgi:hypothetical protein
VAAASLRCCSRARPARWNYRRRSRASTSAREAARQRSRHAAYSACSSARQSRCRGVMPPNSAACAARSSAAAATTASSYSSRRPIKWALAPAPRKNRLKPGLELAPDSKFPLFVATAVRRAAHHPTRRRGDRPRRTQSGVDALPPGGTATNVRRDARTSSFRQNATGAGARRRSRRP